jgi:hypothetical protein
MQVSEPAHLTHWVCFLTYTSLLRVTLSPYRAVSLGTRYLCESLKLKIQNFDFGPKIRLGQRSCQIPSTLNPFAVNTGTRGKGLGLLGFSHPPCLPSGHNSALGYRFLLYSTSLRVRSKLNGISGSTDLDRRRKLQVVVSSSLLKGLLRRCPSLLVIPRDSLSRGHRI